MNYQQESEKIINWIRKVFEDSVQKKIIIGMSGGIDSSLSCVLATQAIGKENIIPVLLPYGDLSSEGVIDAQLVVSQIGIAKEQVVVIDIKTGVDTIVESITHPVLSATPPREGISLFVPSLDGEGQGEVKKMRRGNSMARVRMIYLFDTAKQQQGLVCGTENKSEHYLGYYTRFGDEASDIEPIRNLYKTHVWGMAKYLGIPNKIITKAPTAGLWQGQTDENEMGFSYGEADKVLYYFIDKKLSEEGIVKKGLAKNLVQKVLERVQKNAFKHRLPFVYNEEI